MESALFFEVGHAFLTFQALSIMHTKQQNLKGLTLSELEQFALSIHEQKYRGKQLFDWLYLKEVDSFELMTSLSKQARERLTEIAVIQNLKIKEAHRSPADDTVKYLFELEDEKKIESVLIPPRKAFPIPGSDEDDDDEQEQTRLTLCISTQVGCALDCAFCATASMGFLRNLTCGEIVDQVMQVKKHSGKRITNIVYMGMGEPLLNYDNVMKSVEIITTGLNIAARHITISTAGWVPGIIRMAEEKRRVKLAFSLHSLDEKLRTELMPVNKKYSWDKTLEAIEYYYKLVKVRVTFEYILFDGLNDREEDIKKLIKLSKRIPCKFNIIPFHSIASTLPTGLGAKLRPTPARRADAFIEQLRQHNVTVFMRSSSGQDILAACGQLAVKNDRKKSNPDRVQQAPLIIEEQRA